MIKKYVSNIASNLSDMNALRAESWKKDEKRNSWKCFENETERSDFLLIYPYRDIHICVMNRYSQDRMIHRRPIHSAQKKVTSDETQSLFVGCHRPSRGVRIDRDAERFVSAFVTDMIHRD